MVIGDPVTVINEGTVTATEETEPPKPQTIHIEEVESFCNTTLIAVPCGITTTVDPPSNVLRVTGKILRL